MRPHHLFKGRTQPSKRLSQQIDVNEVYPCPCCRHRGSIQLITLTEAFGCDCCQKIYVIRDDGFSLEQLCGAHSYRRLWRWTGHQWKQYRQLPMTGWLGVTAMALLLLAALGFWMVLSTSVRWLMVLLAGLLGTVVFARWR